MRWTIPRGGGVVEVLSRRPPPVTYLAEALLCMSLIAVGSMSGSLKNGYRSRESIVSCQAKTSPHPFPKH